MLLQPNQREWVPRDAPASLLDLLKSTSALPLPIARYLACRGIRPQDLALFFRPSLSSLHSPALLRGMAAAVTRIRAAVAAGESILIYGDYDVDGTIATVLLKTAIDRLRDSSLPSLVTWHVPHRIREGYGMRSSRLAEAAADGVRLVISVDTGIRAFAAADEARALNLDLIVTDHHLPDGAAGIPHAVAVINPAQPGCDYPCKDLCGAAVAFKLAHALLLSHAEDEADPEAARRSLEDRLLPSFLKLVSIATIADSVPLTGENRTIASLGLRELANPVQPGLRALMEVAALPLDQPPTASDVGFRIGPRINAAGRMDVADDVIELFLTRSPARANELAQKLNSLNEDRRATERAAMDLIEQSLLQSLGQHTTYPSECFVLDHPDWHRGVLGILASRVVDRTGRPALVVTHEDGEAHGSGRSVPGFHLLDALTAAHDVHCDEAATGTLLTRFGGHAHAVGFSLPLAHLPLLRQRLRVLSEPLLSNGLLSVPHRYDAEVTTADLNLELASAIERCAPFGNSHPEPVFLLRRALLSQSPRIIKERHLSLQLQEQPGHPKLRAVAWSRPGEDWAHVARHLELNSGCSVDLLARLRAHEGPWFTGLELQIVDFRRSDETSAPFA